MKSIPAALFGALLILVVAAPRGASGQANSITPEHCLGGTLDAPIRIEVFSDFECPSCREFYLNSIRPVLKDYCSLDKVCVVYYEFPLASHKYSREAARNSKAAQRLGRKEWLAVMDALYINQQKWSQNGSVDEVVFLALGADDYLRLKKMLLAPSIDTSIESEISMGKKREVTSTPTLFVNAIGREQKVVGGLPYSVLKDFFDSIVK